MLLPAMLHRSVFNRVVSVRSCPSVLSTRVPSPTAEAVWLAVVMLWPIEDRRSLRKFTSLLQVSPT